MQDLTSAPAHLFNAAEWSSFLIPGNPAFSLRASCCVHTMISTTKLPHCFPFTWCGIWGLMNIDWHENTNHCTASEPTTVHRKFRKGCRNTVKLGHHGLCQLYHYHLVQHFPPGKAWRHYWDFGSHGNTWKCILSDLVPNLSTEITVCKIFPGVISQPSISREFHSQEITYPLLLKTGLNPICTLTQCKQGCLQFVWP